MPALVSRHAIEDAKGLEGRRGYRPAVQHGGNISSQRLKSSPVEPSDLLPQNGRRGLGQDAGLGVMRQGRDVAILEPEIHGDPVAASRVVGGRRPVRRIEPSSAGGVGGQAQQFLAVKGIAHVSRRAR